MKCLIQAHLFFDKYSKRLEITTFCRNIFVDNAEICCII
nr:MAG TPA: hypothetical protein [Caudoviricetes sp.]